MIHKHSYKNVRFFSSIYVTQIIIYNISFHSLIFFFKLFARQSSWAIRRGQRTESLPEFEGSVCHLVAEIGTDSRPQRADQFAVSSAPYSSPVTSPLLSISHRQWWNSFLKKIIVKIFATFSKISAFAEPFFVNYQLFNVFFYCYFTATSQ